MANGGLAKVDPDNIFTRLGAGLRTTVLPKARKLAGQIAGAVTAPERAALGAAQDVGRGFSAAGPEAGLAQPVSAVAPQISDATNQVQFQGPSPVAPVLGGVRVDPSRTVSVRGAEGGTGSITVPGGVRRIGQAGATADSSQVGTTTDPRTGLSIGGISRAAGADFLNRRFAGPQRQHVGRGPGSAGPRRGSTVDGGASRIGGSFGDVVLQGLQGRSDKLRAGIEDQRRRTDILGFSAQTGAADVGLRGRRLSIDAARNAALAPGAAAQAELTQAQAAKAGQINAISEELLRPDTTPERRQELQAQHDILSGTVRTVKPPKVFLEKVLGEGGEQVQGFSQTPSGGLRRLNIEGATSLAPAKTSINNAIAALSTEQRAAADAEITRMEEAEGRKLTDAEVMSVLGIQQ